MARRRNVRVVLVASVVTALALVGVPVALVGVPVAASAATTSVTVAGTANLFGADLTVPPGTEPGTSPPSIDISGSKSLTVSATGSVDCNGLQRAGTPDAGACSITDSDVDSLGKIAGLVDNTASIFLAGVFTDGTPATTAPARLTYGVGALTHDDPSYSPVINQTFFIGDGKTSGGSSQTFAIPAGATKLYLGVVDAFSVHGTASYYGDNTGSFSAQVTASATTPVVAATTVTSPSYSAVEYIKEFSRTACLKDLHREDVGAVAGARAAANYPSNPVRGYIAAKIAAAAAEAALCEALYSSRNPEPPTSLRGAALNQFVATKELRGMTRIPAYSLQCSAAGDAVSLKPTDSVAFLTDLGYTKTHIGDGPISYNRFPTGDGFLLDPRRPDATGFNTSSPVVKIDLTSATISFKWASRIANFERRRQFDLSGYDAPFVWMTFSEKLSCSGAQKATFAFTNFPATNLYVNDTLVKHSDETTRIGNFIKQGGTTLNGNGVGYLAFPCRIRTFTGKDAQLTTSSDACQDNKLP